MARLTCSRSGWGTVQDPETGERVDVTSEVDDDVAERLADEYAAIEVEDTNSETEDDDSSDDETTVDERAVELADASYQDAVDAVVSGEADEYLDDLEEADDRVTVQDAIEDRREDLEE